MQYYVFLLKDSIIIFLMYKGNYKYFPNEHCPCQFFQVMLKYGSSLTLVFHLLCICDRNNFALFLFNQFSCSFHTALFMNVLTFIDVATHKILKNTRA